MPYVNGSNCGVPENAVVLAFMAIAFIMKVVLVLAGVVIAFRSRIIHIGDFNERVELGYAI